MSNFDFVQKTLPSLFEDVARAESYYNSDPRTSVIYARRSIESAVRYLYDLHQLPVGYRDDLASLTKTHEFQALTHQLIGAKLDYIRRIGNKAVHSEARISRSDSLAVVSELFHLYVWLAREHSTQPEIAPSGKRFDPNLANDVAALTPAERNTLVENFESEREQLVDALKESDQRSQEQDVEIARLRKEINEAHNRLAGLPEHDYNEADTRARVIDLHLAESGWNPHGTNVREYEVTGMPNYADLGFVDYVLWGNDGLPLAVIEAKRLSRSATAAQQQALKYAEALNAQFGREPVIYYTNGIETFVWDRAGGYPPRRVQGYATRDQLELMVARRESRRALATVPINRSIAGRYYQERAIAAVSGVLESKRRKALLVMATGSGKTRTVIALVERLLAAGWVKNVLFLADRTALVTQAVNAFKDQLPNEPVVNLPADATGVGRVYAATYPTMMNRINEFTNAGERRFGPGFFDLVIIDEAHRSVYAKYGAIFDWFDSYLVGLTATPKDEVDHNTYDLFELESGNPTDEYSLEQAVTDGYLVPASAVAVGTKFLRDGIKYSDLSDSERDEWDMIDWGTEESPDEVTSEELNRFLFNKDTVDKVLAQLMSDGDRVTGGERIGKTIIFAKNQKHAEFIQKRFDIQYPHFGGEYARVITYQSQYAHTLIDAFKVAERAPHIAISVDMLDTGIDVPEVVNLVFFKQVRSKVKFWQMIGRGTRLCPDLFGPGLDKTSFKVFDYCGNLEYFAQDLPGTEGSTQKSLTQRIVEQRIDVAAALGELTSRGSLESDGGDDGIDELKSSILRELKSFVDGIAPENFLVRPHLSTYSKFTIDTAWNDFDAEAAVDAKTLAGLPSGSQLGDVDAKRFDLLILRRQHAQLTGNVQEAEKVRVIVQEIAAQLLTKVTVPAVAEHLDLIDQVSSDEWWVGVSLPMLELVRKRMRNLLRLIDPGSRKVVYTDFEDLMGEGQVIDLPGASMNVNKARFKAKVLAFLASHEAHPAILKLRHALPLTAGDLDGLDLVLASAGGVSASTVAELAAESGGLANFVRSIVGLERSSIVEQFAAYLDGALLNADQIRFVDHVIDELCTNGVMEPKRLWEEPFTDPATSGPDYVFPNGEYTKIINFLRDFQSAAESEVH